MDISKLAIIVHTKDKDINYSTNQNKIGFLKGTGAKSTEFINKEDFNKFISEEDTFAYIVSPTTMLYIKKEELLYFKIKDIPFWGEDETYSSFYYDPVDITEKDYLIPYLPTMYFPINKAAFISALRNTYKNDRFIDSIILSWEV